MELRRRAVTSSVVVVGAKVADAVTATLSTLGDALVLVSARVAATDRVLVLFHNPTKANISLGKGTLRAVVTEMA
jgi:hypothetical protein|eukprot:COSAG01_NODE_1066_length_11878_cov_244.494949_10_plen_75_part_00